MNKVKQPLFSSEFKREAVQLLESGAKEASQLARELGIRRNQLYKWKQAIDQHGVRAFPGKGGRPKGYSKTNTAHLEAEVKKLREENEILKSGCVLCERAQVKYAFIDDQRKYYSVTALCRVLGVSQRGYYDWVKRLDSAREQANQSLLVEIKRLFKESREVYGAPRIHQELRKAGHFCSLNRVARLMQKAGIVPKTVRKFRATTDSRKSYKPAENLLDQDFSATRPNEKWAADVTYIPTREGWLFLAVILDLFTRKVVGWSMSDRLTAMLSMQALKNALAQTGKKVDGLLHHSDRGKEYYAKEYQKLLTEHGIICSMSRKGNCYDNAMMESFFHSLKVELVHHNDYRTRSQARADLFEYVELFYNRKRCHSSIGYLSPIEFEKLHAGNKITLANCSTGSALQEQVQLSNSAANKRSALENAICTN